MAHFLKAKSAPFSAVRKQAPGYSQAPFCAKLFPMQYGKKEIPVLFENDFCLVLNKPSGLSVQGGEGVKLSLDLILSENYKPRPLLVHRLDRDTSGIILVAKSKEAARAFSALLSGQEAEGKGAFRVVKRYLGLCSGKPSGGVIRLDLDVHGKLKTAETRFRQLSAFDSSLGSFSLLELELGTGRMHQIRRQLSQKGFPLLGDDKYGDFPLNKKLKKETGLKNLLLHASELIIPPLAELPEGLELSAPLPDYFSRFVVMLTDTPRFT